MAVLIARTPIIDDSGSGMDGTVFENAWKQELYNQIDAALAGAIAAVPPIQVVTATGPLVLLAGPVKIVSAQSGGTITINYTAPPNPGERLVIVNQGPAGSVVLLPHATGAGGFLNMITAVPTPLGRGGAAHYVAVGTNWNLVGHEQGAWIAAPFNPANFIPGSGSWTVSAGGVTYLKYRVTGKSVLVAVQFDGSGSVAGGSANPLYMLNAAYGGFTAVGAAQNPISIFAGGWMLGHAQIHASTPDRVTLFRADFAVFPNGAVNLNGVIQFEAI